MRNTILNLLWRYSPIARLKEWAYLQRFKQYPIKLAGVVYGRAFYTIDPPERFPIGRLGEIQNFMAERDMKITRDEAKLFYQSIRKDLEALTKLKADESGNYSIDLGAANNAMLKLMNLEDRLDWVMEPETILRFFCVTHFTIDESPQTFDYAYNFGKGGKMEWLKKKEDTYNLLQTLHIAQLLPYTWASSESFQSYLSEVQKNHYGQLKKIVASLSDEELKAPGVSDMLELLETLSHTLNGKQ